MRKLYQVFASVIAIVLILLLCSNFIGDNYTKKTNKKSSEDSLTKIISDVVDNTNLNNSYKGKAKATLYNIVKRIERNISASQRKKGMSPSSEASIILKQNRKLIDSSKGSIKKIIVIGDTRYIIGKNNKIREISKVQLESYTYEDEKSGWDINITIGEEIPTEDYSCFGQEGPNVLCPPDLPKCCYGPTNPPTGLCKEECSDDFDTFVNDYLPDLLTTLGVAVISAWASGILVGGGFLLIGIALVVSAVVLIILKIFEDTDPELGSIWEIIKDAVSSIFNAAKIDRPFEEDNLIDELPVLDEASEALVVGQNDGVDNIVADDMPGSTGTDGSDAYVNVRDFASRGISKTLLELTLLPGIFDRNISKKCDLDKDCGDISRRANETTQEHMRRIKCCLTTRRVIPDISFEIPPADSTDDLLPPPGSGNDDNIACVTRCFNGYTGVVCTNRDTGQTVSETWSSDQNIARCCTTQCINDTWHTVCTPHSGVDSGISCDNRPPKL